MIGPAEPREQMSSLIRRERPVEKRFQRGVLEAFGRAGRRCEGLGDEAVALEQRRVE